MSGPKCGSSRCAHYYVGNAKVAQNVNQFHIGGIWQVDSTSGAHHYKQCTIDRHALILIYIQIKFLIVEVGLEFWIMHVIV